MDDIGLRGLALLDAAVDHIRMNPEEWYQADWRCESGMCVAGWVCELAGGQWATAASTPDHMRRWLVSDPHEPGAVSGSFLKNEGCRYVEQDQWYINAGNRAYNLLGSDVVNTSVWLNGDMFGPNNSLDDIEEIVKGIHNKE